MCICEVHWTDTFLIGITLIGTKWIGNIGNRNIGSYSFGRFRKNWNKWFWNIWMIGFLCYLLSCIVYLFENILIGELTFRSAVWTYPGPMESWLYRSLILEKTRVYSTGKQHKLAASSQKTTCTLQLSVNSPSVKSFRKSALADNWDWKHTLAYRIQLYSVSSSSKTK